MRPLIRPFLRQNMADQLASLSRMQRPGAARRHQNNSRENNQRCRQFKRDDFASRARREDKNYQRTGRRKLEETIVDECADGAACVFSDIQCLHGGSLQHACFRIRSNIKVCLKKLIKTTKKRQIVVFLNPLCSCYIK